MTATKPPMYHPGALTDAVVRHRLAILASVPAAAAPLALVILAGISLTFFMPVIAVGLILLCLLFGVLTAIPTRMILRTTPNYEMDGWIAVPFAAAFPIWGSLIAMLSMGLLAPVTCTAAWCVAIGPCLGRRRASQLWLTLSFLPVLFAVVIALLLAAMAVPAAMLIAGAGVVIAWLALHPFALALATELHRCDLAWLRVRCDRCGYPTEGLAAGMPCPECGL